MTRKEHEDRFIAQCKTTFGVLTFESELLLRYGYSTGAQERGRVAFAEGVREQREQVLGAATAEMKELP